MAVDKLINETQGNDIIDKLDDIASNLENVSAITPAKLGLGYAVCDTAASTAAKVATLANYSLTEGGLVSVKFTNANTATNATLNLNSTGAKPIYYKGSAIGNNVISAGDIATFVYSTNAYNIVNIDTLTGAGSGTVTQVGADNGLITDQTGGADIQRSGNIGLNLKSTTAYTGTVADPSSAVSVSDGRVYPVALDGDGHPVVGVPWIDTTYSNGTGITIGAGNVINHSNSVTASSTTPGALKIKYDAQGHITGSSALAASDIGLGSTGTAVTGVSTTATTSETGYIEISSYDSNTKTLTIKGILAPTANTFVKTS